MKHSIISIATAAVFGLSLSGVAQADFTANMSKIDGDQLSGNGSGTVNANCSDYAGQYDGATATIENAQPGGTGKVKVQVKGAKPNTHYTVWVRLKGKDRNGVAFGGSPITGGGATPLAPSTALDGLVADWDGSGNEDGGANSFFTNHQGKGQIHINTDFPLEGGAYPFNRMSDAALATALGKNPGALAVPTAIADPRDAGITGTPFLVRVVSHCQDGESHGMSPSVREPWFQYP